MSSSAGSSPRGWASEEEAYSSDAITPEASPTRRDDAAAEAPADTSPAAQGTARSHASSFTVAKTESEAASPIRDDHADASPVSRRSAPSPTATQRTAAASPERAKAVPSVPFEEPLARKARRLPRIYTRPPTIGVFMPPIKQPARRTPAPKRSDSSGVAAINKSQQAQGGRPSSAPADSPRAPPPPKRMADMNDEELAEALRRRLEERRSVPRLSKRRATPPPPVKVADVINLTPTSADIVVANRVPAAPAEGSADAASGAPPPGSVRLMISVDGGVTFRTQAVAPADVFRVDGLNPGTRYHTYAVAVGEVGKVNTKPAGKGQAAAAAARKTVVHFTTRNAPAVPRMGAVPGQEVTRHTANASGSQAQRRPASLPPISQRKPVPA